MSPIQRLVPKAVLISLLIYQTGAIGMEESSLFSRALRNLHSARDSPLPGSILQIIGDLLLDPKEPGGAMERRVMDIYPRMARSGRFQFPTERPAQLRFQQQGRSSDTNPTSTNYQPMTSFKLFPRNRVGIVEPVARPGRDYFQSSPQIVDIIDTGYNRNTQAYQSNLSNRTPVSEYQSSFAPTYYLPKRSRALDQDDQFKSSEQNSLASEAYFRSPTDGVVQPRQPKLMKPAIIRSQPLIIKDARQGKSMKEIEVQGVKIIVGAKTPDFPKDNLLSWRDSRQIKSNVASSNGNGGGRPSSSSSSSSTSSVSSSSSVYDQGKITLA